jgi:polyisoprenoid-binding protein YceI
MSNFRTRASLALILPAAVLAGAWTTFGGRLSVEPESRLWIDGTSTVRSFTCSATKLEGNVGFAGQLGTTIEEAGRAVDVVEIEIPVAALDCRNGTMNEHMWKALQARDFPTIHYRMTARDLAAGANGGLTVSLVGKLTIAGAERPITMNAEATQDSSGRYRISGRHELLMTEFGVKPPSLMLGTMKVRDKVVVRYEILLARPADVAEGSS